MTVSVLTVQGIAGLIPSSPAGLRISYTKLAGLA